MSLAPCFLVIDKPPGLTSHDVVAIVRAVTGIKKVGHTGTLDPLASGVLPLALGGATRFIQYLDEGLKVYDATVGLGSRTATGDREGEVVEQAPVPSLDNLPAVLESFLGERMQVPPAYSAVKVKGKALYKYARAGDTVKAAARAIRVYGLEEIERGDDSFRCTISCSRGTYARVLAEELGVALGSVGHLASLRRLRSGPFEMEHALDLSTLAQFVADTPSWERAFRRPKEGEERLAWKPRAEVFASLAPYAWPLERALGHLPQVQLSGAVADGVRKGSLEPPGPAELTPGQRFAVMGEQGFLAVAERHAQGAKVLRRLGEERQAKRHRDKRRRRR